MKTEKYNLNLHLYFNLPRHRFLASIWGGGLLIFFFSFSRYKFGGFYEFVIFQVLIFFGFDDILMNVMRKIICEEDEGGYQETNCLKP